MMAEMMKPGAGAGARNMRHACKADAAEIIRTAPRWKAASVIFEGVDGPQTLILKGRTLWALCELLQAGPRGVTPIERVGPRWSHYVFQLRTMGLDIDTTREVHGGNFPGHHERYVLRSPIAIAGGAHV